MASTANPTRPERLARGALWAFSLAVLLFLIAPILVIVPVSYQLP